VLSADTIVRATGLGKTFGRRAHTVTALSGVSLEIRRGEVVGLLGRNGAGKTTLVKALLGLVRPTAGSVTLFGRRPGDPLAHRSLGYSPEEPGFPKFLYPRQVLEMCGRLSGLTGPALAAAVERQLELAELTGAGDRQARHLSKGMRQRLSLAQAFIHSPEFVVLDEPTADLDPVGRRQIRDLIDAYRKEGGTVLLNSHLLSEVERLCDRVSIMHAGRVVREGSLDELVRGDRDLEDVFIEVVAGE
jgi:ABC-2 type transport system ATP-binding protein